MGMWTAIALISIAAIIGECFRHRGKNHRHKNDEEINALHQRIDDLENNLRNRVETLERIVTDRKDDLRREFEYLDKAS